MLLIVIHRLALASEVQPVQEQPGLDAPIPPEGQRVGQAQHGKNGQSQSETGALDIEQGGDPILDLKHTQRNGSGQTDGNRIDRQQIHQPADAAGPRLIAEDNANG